MRLNWLQIEYLHNVRLGGRQPVVIYILTVTFIIEVENSTHLLFEEE